MLDSLTSALFARIASRPQGHAAFALIDMAGLSHLEQARVIFHQIQQAGATSVLQDERPDAVLATPWLLPLPDAPDLPVEAFARLLKRSCQWALRGPAVSWIVSPLPVESLAQRLRQRTEAELPGQHPVLLRHFDPRVLPELVHALHEPQRKAFSELGHEWLYLDRSHALQSIALHAAPESDSLTAPLLLDDQQFAALLAASEIDQLMPEMARSAPVEFMSLSVPERVKTARECLRLAQAWRLEGLSNQAVLGLLLLKLGEGFHKMPEWAPWIEPMTLRRMSLLSVIERATGGPT